MPTDIQPRELEKVNLDNEPFKFGIDEIKDAYALELVSQTFFQYETFRTSNHDVRWNIADALYYGWLPAKTWEGTAIPRASLGMPIVFDQIQAALPAISQEIFAPQDEWFQVETEEGATVQEARQVQEHLSYVLEHSKNDYGLSARNELELAFESMLLYGNGGIGIEWDPVLNRAVVQWVDTRDFYVDPGCPIPNIDESRAVIRRKMMTVDELVMRRQDPRMKIPEDGVLYSMSKTPLFANADATKQSAEAIRGVNYAPNVTDYSPYPADRKIEVLIYYSKTRIIWLLNRQLVIYNEENPYGFIPFCFAPCYIVPGRFYAQAIADVQEGNQRYVEALLNARLDALTLEIMPPRIYKQGALLTPSQIRWRPGATYQAGDTKDMALLQPQSQMTNVFSEIQYITDASEKRTGINSMNSGIPHPSNTNRTATGVNAVSSGSMSRLRYLVSNIENYLIIPLLYKLYSLVQKHTLPDQKLSGLSKEGALTKVDTNSFQGKMRFRMLASSKMMTRDKLASVFPVLAQYMMNGTFVSEIQKTGKTIDFEEMFQLLRDATGTGRLYNFIRTLSEEEKKAMQQPSPEVLAEQQQSQAELQTRLQMGDKKSQTDIAVAQIKSQPNPQEMEQEQQRFMMDMDREKARIHSEQTLAKIKAQSEMEKHRIDAAGKQQELQGKQAEIGMNLQASQMQHQQELQQMQQAGETERSQNFADHVLGLKQSSEQHGQKLENMKSEAKIKQQSRKKAEVKKKERGPKA